MEKLINERDLYLMLFDENMEKSVKRNYLIADIVLLQVGMQLMVV